MTEGEIDFEHFRVRIVQLREELQAFERSGNADANAVELDQQRQGRLSRMDALSAQAMSLEARCRRRATLQRFEAALRRIDSGGYRLCVRCDEENDPQRLEFDPTALLCIDCASKAEG